MRVREWILAVAVLALAGGIGDCRKCYLAVGESARSFQGYFQALKAASLNPMERFVFSLALANTKTHPPAVISPQKRGT
ncbi:MAG TPA: hypothetical protein VFA33_24890 [Bryobacteraceae bacterium]|nr:hypothetical protein [Bryobacteraceae bacterium]